MGTYIGSLMVVIGDIIYRYMRSVSNVLNNHCRAYTQLATRY